MGRLRLQSQLLISTLLILCALTGAIVLIIRHTVLTQMDAQVKYGTEASIEEFGRVQQQSKVQLSRTASLLAEIPTLKALMTTRHAPTIQDGSIPFWNLAGSDLFLLADPSGRIVALDVTGGQSLNRAAAEKDLGAALRAGEDSAWWYSGGRLYWIFVRPILAGKGDSARVLGLVAIGYDTNSRIREQLGLVADGKIALVAGNRIIASTFSTDEEGAVQQRIAKGDALPGGASAAELELGNQTYELARVTLPDVPPSPVESYVFVPLTRQMEFLMRLNRTILVVGLAAILLATLSLRLVSRTITHPLDNLVAGVRALAAGDYAYSIPSRGSSEAVELAEAFSKMRGELLAFQKKQIETERVAAVGRAANSISHDLRHHLAALVANAEFLYEADRLKLNKDEVYREIQTASEQMTELLDSLRDLAREQRNIAPVHASMDACVRHAIDSVRARPELRDCDISVHTEGDMSGDFDPKKIERALLNLALNACEATRTPDAKIAVDVRSTAGAFEIRISDNGPGIPAPIRHNLFDPFISMGKPNGTGLGLAIVSKIIADHGGTVSVENTSEKGTTFLVSMPRVQRLPSTVAEQVVT